MALLRIKSTCVLLSVYCLATIANSMPNSETVSTTESPQNLWIRLRQTYYQNRSALTGSISERGNFGGNSHSSNSNNYPDSDRIIFVDLEESNQHHHHHASEKCNGTRHHSQGGCGGGGSSVPPVINRHRNPFVKNEYHRNESTGEYLLEIEFSDGNRRLEIGELERNENGTELFVIRGLFTYHEEGVLHNVLYKIDPEKGYMTFEDPLAQPVDFAPEFGMPEGDGACDPNSRFNSRCIDQKLINILVG